MAKHDRLREYLVAALPELARYPDKLLIYMTGGTIAARMGGNLGFEYRAQLQLDVLDFPGEPAAFFLPFLLWVRRHEPAVLLAHDDRALRFDIDVRDQGAVDISIQLPMSEAVDVLPRSDGSGYDMTLRPESPIVDTEFAGGLPEPDPLPLLRRIYANGALLVGTAEGAPPPNPDTDGILDFSMAGNSGLILLFLED